MDRSREDNLENAASNAGRTMGEAAATAAHRVGEKFEQGKDALMEVQSAVTEKTRECLETTDSYVRDNPWQAVGIAAGVGFLVGLLISRR